MSVLPPDGPAELSTTSIPLYQAFGTAVAVAVSVTHNAPPKRGAGVMVGHEFELGCVVPLTFEVAGVFIYRLLESIGGVHIQGSSHG